MYMYNSFTDKNLLSNRQSKMKKLKDVPYIQLKIIFFCQYIIRLYSRHKQKYNAVDKFINQNMINKHTNYLSQNELNYISTQQSNQSTIDKFSKLETSFLQKYFKFLVIDHFNHFLSNFYESFFYKKLYNQSKHISSSLFYVEKNFNIHEFISKIEEFFSKTQNSEFIHNQDFPFAIKLIHSNIQSFQFKVGQLVYIDIRIKLQGSKIEEIPADIEKLFASYQIYDQSNKSKDNDLKKILNSYKKEYFNVFIFYYGDINFRFEQKQTYNIKTMKLIDRNIKVKIFVLYVSKIALTETFKFTNKIKFSRLNDLIISYYERKRENQKDKQLKKVNNTKKKIQFDQKVNQIRQLNLKKVIVIIGILTAGIFVFKSRI